MTALARLAAVAAASLILLVPALWNGSILFYWDSVDYIYLAHSFKLPIYRTMPYGLFAGMARLTGTLWAVGAVQALLTAWVLHEALAVFASPPKALRWLVPVSVLLVVTTAIGWAVGRLMPDALTGVVILGILALAFDPGHLGTARRAFLAAMIAVGAAVHTSHIGVALGLVLALGAGAWLLRRRWPELKPRLVLAGCAALASLPLVAGIHWAVTGKAFVTQPANVLFLARLTMDGLAKRTLDELCPTMDLKLCPFKDRFPPTANDFLWDHQAIAKRVAPSWRSLDPEARLIIRESLRRFPLQHAWTALLLTGDQLSRFRTGDGLVKDVSWIVADSLQRYYPNDRERFRASRQRAGIDFDAINMLHVPVAAAGQLGLLAVLWLAWRRRERLTFGLAVGLVLAFLGNAFICGALSNPNDRYQARIVWLAVFASVVGAARLREASASGEAGIALPPGRPFAAADRRRVTPGVP